jgi:hypothetical protein
MAIVGLYRDIYGLQPKPNRLYLEPHLTPELNGAKLRYPLRGQLYEIDLSTESCAITVGNHTLRDSHPFGINALATGLEYFAGTNTDWNLSISRTLGRAFTVQIESWPDNPMAPRRWVESSPQVQGLTKHSVNHLRPDSIYQLKINGRMRASFWTDKSGRAEFDCDLIDPTPQKFELDLADQ